MTSLASRMTTKQEVDAQLKRVARAIHYPACWDTAAYPTILDALEELASCSGCSECRAKSDKT